MPEAPYSERLLRWKVLLFLLEQKRAKPEKVEPQPSQDVTTERRKESCRE